jgi:hypothetical protein
MAFTQSVLDGRQHADAARKIVRQAARCLGDVHVSSLLKPSYLFPVQYCFPAQRACTCAARPPPRARRWAHGAQSTKRNRLRPACAPSHSSREHSAPRPPPVPDRHQDPPPRGCAARVHSRAPDAPCNRARPRLRGGGVPARDAPRRARPAARDAAPWQKFGLCTSLLRLSSVAIREPA